MPVREFQRSPRSSRPAEIVAAQAVNVTVPGEFLKLKTVNMISRARTNRCWQWYDKIGEVRYAVNRTARTAGHAVIGAYEREGIELGKKLTSDPKITEITAGIWSPNGGQRGLIETFYKLMKMHAQAHLIRLPRNQDGTSAGYEFISDEEFSADDDKLWRTTLPATHVAGFSEADIKKATRVEIAPEDYLGRIWQPHPQFSDMPDSPMYALDSVCEDLYLLGQGVKAKLISRLMSNGVWYIPSEISDVVKTYKEDPDSAGPKYSTDSVLNAIISTLAAGRTSFDDAAGAFPILVRGPGEQAANLVFKYPDIQLQEIDIKLRAEALDRILQGLDCKPESVKGNSDSNHWCRTTGTMAYTRNGWVGPDELMVGDEIMAFDSGSMQADWAIVEDVYRAASKAQGVNVRVSNAHGGPHSYSIKATTGHRFHVIRDGESTFVTGDRLEIGDVIMRGLAAPAPAEAKWSDAFVQLLAWYSADGTITTRPDGGLGQVRIAKSWKENPGATAKLIAALEANFGPAMEAMPRGSNAPAWRMETQERGMMVAVLNSTARDVILGVVPGKEKVIPPSLVDSFTQAQRLLFLDAWRDSDGDGRSAVNQRNPERLDSVERAAVLAGFGVRRSTYENDGFKPGTMHRILISTESTVVVRDVSECEIEGGVWCPTTSAGTWLALDPESGWVDYTGNSSWSTRDEDLKENVLPDLEMLCWSLEQLILIPEAERLGANADNVGLWFDTSAATTRPNVGEDARMGAEMGAVSERGFRASAGIDEEYAPTEEEQVRWLGRKIGDPYLATFGLKIAEKLDYEKIGKAKDPTPGPEQQPAPGKVSPANPGADGTTGKNDSSKRRTQQPAA